MSTIYVGRSLALAAILVSVSFSATARPPVALTPATINAALNEAYGKVREVTDGKNASYIPALANVDPKILGIALVTPQGDIYTVGDTTSEISIQSISKVFTTAIVMDEKGKFSIFDSIGVDATGLPFNSIISIELSKKVYGGPEMNPLVNPGAIAAMSMVAGGSRDAIWTNVLSHFSDFAGRPLKVNEEVFKSEAATNQRNQAIGKLMYAYGYIKENPDQATDIYTEACSISVNVRDLAVMAGTIANGGINPLTGNTVMRNENVAPLLAIMATAGLYDDSGKWLFKTGLPGKSGVGGGIIAVSPGRFAIAVISPPLDTAGNSVKAQLAIAYVSNLLNGNPYDIEPVIKGHLAP